MKYYSYFAKKCLKKLIKNSPNPDGENGRAI